jgi:DNA-binding XRE family transcriptional regulator
MTVDRLWDELMASIALAITLFPKLRLTIDDIFLIFGSCERAA